MTLKELLKKKKFTQEILAQKIGVTQSTVSQWCTKATSPRNLNTRKIADTLGVTLDELYDCFVK